jgi:hypothetical protein
MEQSPSEANSSSASQETSRMGFITAFTRARHLSLSWATPIHSMPQSTDTATLYIRDSNDNTSRYRGPRGLRRETAAARLLGSRIRIPLGAWISLWVLCVVMCCEVEFSATCRSVIQRSPTECGVCDREASIMTRPWPTRGCCTMGKNGNIR